MTLPKLDCLVYELTLPLSKKKIKFRPFLVKEQRNLMIAMEADDKETIERNIKQVMQNCCLTELDIDSLPIIDVEYYFLNLRARSVSEIVENKYECKNIVDGKECGKVMDVKFNLLDIAVDVDPNIKDVIQLSDTMSMKLHYPTFSVLERAKKFENETDMAFDMILDSIDYIFDGKQYYHSKETTGDELQEFVESLSSKQFAKVEEFFSNLPKMNKKLDLKCSKCGFQHTIEVEGLENFFG